MNSLASEVLNSPSQILIEWGENKREKIDHVDDESGSESPLLNKGLEQVRSS